MPSAEQIVVKVVAMITSYICQVESGTGAYFLTSLPPVFGQDVIISTGDYLLVDYVENGGIVKAELVTVLSQAHIKFYGREGVWPERFSDALVNVAPFQRFLRYLMLKANSSSSDEETDTDYEDDSGIE